SKALGMNDSRLYATSTTDFGKATRNRPSGTLSVAGAMLSAKAQTTPTSTPTAPPTTTPTAPTIPTPTAPLTTTPTAPTIPTPTAPVTTAPIAPSTTTTPDPLQGIPFISADTFVGSQLTTGRDSLEVEAVRAATGASPAEMYKFLTTDKNG